MTTLKYTPCIIIPGIGHSKTYIVDANENKLKNAWPLDINGEEIMNELKGPIMKLMLFHKEDSFADKIESMIRKAVSPLTTDNSGNMQYETRVVSYPKSLSLCNDNEKKYIYKMVPMQKLTEIIGEDNLYFFAFNSFGKPYENAALLNEFIQNVKKETNSERVNLISVSLGGALSTAYFDAYGAQNDVERVLYFVAALNGTQLMSDIFNDNLNYNNTDQLLEMLTNKKTAQSIEDMKKFVSKDFPPKLINRILKAIKEEVLLNSASMWSLIPQKDYSDLAERYLSSPEKEALRSQTDKYHNAQKNLKNIIIKMQKKGTEFFAVCGYGLPLVGISASNTVSSDSIINVSSSSLGAVTAPLGNKLETVSAEKYCDNNFHNHISPDETLDASYGLLPETTWYFKYQKHDDTAYNNTALKIAEKLMSDKNFNNIYSDELLGQFGIAQDNRK